MKAVILAGGEGLGLYPLSRKNKPKQFHSLISHQSLLVDCYKRVRRAFEKEDIYLVTTSQYADLVKKHLPDLAEKNLLLEPFPKNTAAAIGLAAVHFEKQEPSQVMAVFYTNHVVENNRSLYKALAVAEKVVKLDNLLVSIDVNPAFPSDKLGYVKIGRALREIEGQIVFEFKQFVEKPTSEQAKRFLESWEYLWNTGFVVVRADKLLSLYKKHLPNLYKTLLEIKKVLGSASQEEVVLKMYKNLESISFDYGLMEKIDPKNVAVIPADLGWVDVRSWPILYEHLKQNRAGNVVKANSLELDTQNCLIFGRDKKLIVTFGVKNLVVIDTEDILFVSDVEKSEDVGEVIKRVEKMGKKKYL